MAKKTSKESKAKALFEENLGADEAKFFMVVYLQIRRKRYKTVHHMFCDTIAESISTPDHKVTKQDVQNIVLKFKKKPFKYVDTNRDNNFAGFRATEYFVGWLANNGIF